MKAHKAAELLFESLLSMMNKKRSVTCLSIEEVPLSVFQGRREHIISHLEGLASLHLNATIEVNDIRDGLGNLRDIEILLKKEGT